MPPPPPSLLTNQPTGTALIGTGDADRGRILRTNSRMADILASTPQALVGTDACEHIHPDDRSDALATFSGLVLDASRAHEGTIRLLASDGTTRPVTLFASTVAYSGSAALLVRVGPANG